MPPILIVPLILMAVPLVLVLMSIKVVPDKRRLAITRLGQFVHLAGPGVVVVVPIVDRGVPVEVGQEGLLLEDGTGDFGEGMFLKVETDFAGHKAGARIRIERFEGAKGDTKVIVGRAS